MTAHEALQALDDAIAGAEPTDRPALIIGLAARLAALGASIATAQPAQSVDPAPPGAGDFNLRPEQAADLAGVSVGQIYRWSKGQKWASRPSKRCVRISEVGFRRWLASKAYGH